MHAVNALDPSSAATLAPYLGAGQTLVLLGSSGAGKSTLTNALIGRAVQDTGAVRADDSRGRHTTTVRSLHRLPGGACVIDTPGLRGLAPDIDEAGLAASFEDIQSLASQCRFRDCTHADEPGCAVRAGVAPDRLAQLPEAAARHPARHADAAAEARDRVDVEGAEQGRGGTDEVEARLIAAARRDGPRERRGYDRRMPPEPAARPSSPLDLFVTFTLLALQGFGGVLAVTQRELCERKRWLTHAEFVEILSFGQVLPGPNVVNVALMIGDRFFGARGAFAALAGMMCVPLVIVLGRPRRSMSSSRTMPAVAGALRGMGGGGGRPDHRRRAAAGGIAARDAAGRRASRSRSRRRPSWQWPGFALPLVWVLLGLGVGRHRVRVERCRRSPGASRADERH